MCNSCRLWSRAWRNCIINLPLVLPTKRADMIKIWPGLKAMGWSLLKSKYSSAICMGGHICGKYLRWFRHFKYSNSPRILRVCFDCLSVVVVELYKKLANGLWLRAMWYFDSANKISNVNSFRNSAKRKSLRYSSVFGWVKYIWRLSKSIVMWRSVTGIASPSKTVACFAKLMDNLKRRWRKVD